MSILRNIPDSLILSIRPAQFTQQTGQWTRYRLSIQAFASMLQATDASSSVILLPSSEMIFGKGDIKMAPSRSP